MARLRQKQKQRMQRPLPPGLHGIEPHNRLKPEDSCYGCEYMEPLDTPQSINRGGPLGVEPCFVATCRLHDARLLNWSRLTEIYMVPRRAIGCGYRNLFNYMIEGGRFVYLVRAGDETKIERPFWTAAGG